MPDTLSPNETTDYGAIAVQQHRERVWNALIPPCTVRAEVKPYGVRYLHPTKGYKTVGKRRFAIRGVW
jgi:hypothetical protein